MDPKANRFSDQPPAGCMPAWVLILDKRELYGEVRRLVYHPGETCSHGHSGFSFFGLVIARTKCSPKIDAVIVLIMKATTVTNVARELLGCHFTHIRRMESVKITTPVINAKIRAKAII